MKRPVATRGRGFGLAHLDYQKNRLDQERVFLNTALDKERRSPEKSGRRGLVSGGWAGNFCGGCGVASAGELASVASMKPGGSGRRELPGRMRVVCEVGVGAACVEAHAHGGQRRAGSRHVTRVGTSRLRRRGFLVTKFAPDSHCAGRGAFFCGTPWRTPAGKNNATETLATSHQAGM